MTPVTRCDVLVVGGGSAGLAAAIAAARSGAHTMLVEWHATLGGMATAALVHSVCGLYLLRDDPGAVAANPGFATEIADRLLAIGGAWGPVRMGRVDVLPHRPAAFARVADETACATEGLELRFHTAVIGIEGDSTVEAVDLSCRGARERVVPRVVVDASGDAVVCALGGFACEMEPSERLQRPAYVFLLEGVAEGALADQARLVLAHRIASAVRAGALPEGALGASLRATDRPGEAYVTIDLAGPPGMAYDPTNPRCLSALEVHGRALAARLADHLRAEVDGFAGSWIAALPARVGIRESRRAIGERRIETADIERGATFPDAVALATWPMEMREQPTGPRLRFPVDGRPTQIPLGALRVRGVPNLLVAGRCISASHEAQASLRVIGTCLATGEAAGLAAALLADGFAAPDTTTLAAAVNAARERIMLPAPGNGARASGRS
ncbi:MAG TPA: FAD-dependent oxidoreductase [Candidatus Binatia bacterium]